MRRNAEAEREAVLRVIDAETRAYFDKDFEAWARCWVQEAYIRRWMWFGRSGITTREGWDQQGPSMKLSMQRYPLPNRSAAALLRENMNVRVGADMAWVTFDQYGPKTGDSFDVTGLQQEMRVLEKHDGEWRIAFVCVLQRSLDYIDVPLIRVDAKARVLWMNEAARTAIRERSALTERAGTLRATDKSADQKLQAAIAWAAAIDDGLAGHYTSLPIIAKHSAIAVVLGGGRGEQVEVCWVVADSSMVLVSLNDQQMTGQRLAAAAAIHGLTQAQLRLAAEILRGADIVQAAAALKISANTARTQLKRMFEKTGVRSQPALVRILLSAASPLG